MADLVCDWVVVVVGVGSESIVRSVVWVWDVCLAGVDVVFVVCFYYVKLF